jgi:diguanylate cyclase (GGDEF) domain
MLSLAMVASGCAAVIHWFSPVHRTLDLIVPPTMFAVFGGLLVALMRRPESVIAIARTALVVAGLAMVAPTWLDTLQATLTPGLQLVGILPPIASLFVMLVMMVMLFFPPRQAFRIALLAWVLVALPVLVYLFAHPLEMGSPRGKDLLMTYGPVIVMVTVLIPVQRGLTGKIQRLSAERARMEVMIHRDPLTGIHNRHHSDQVLQNILSERRAAGVIMFDMDRFKAINDTHGHPAGDHVLQAVAQRCIELLRKDECVSRWGGEEFLVVVPDINAAGLQQLAERLRQAIAELVVEPVPQVTASFGVALIEAGDSIPNLLQRVDQALYRAKQQGGNCVAW